MPKPPRFKVRKTDRGWVVNVPPTLSESGRRERLYHKTRDAAAATAERFRNEFLEHGQKSVLIGPALAQEALRCHEQLAEVGASLTDATKLFLERWKAEHDSVELRVAAAKWMETKATRRVSTIKSYEYTIAKLEGLMGLQMASITADQIDDALGNGGPTAKAMHIRNARALWRWSERKGWADSKVIGNIDLPPAPEAGDIAVLTASECRALLEAAETHYPESVPAFSMALFAGLRASELRQITWADIGEDGIEIAPTVSKTKRRRLVPISPTLATWLDEHRPTDVGGDVLVVPGNWPQKWRAVRRLAGWRVSAPLLERDKKVPPKLRKGAKPWPSNALRHTHASVEIALGRPLTELVFAFGHSGGVDVLLRHYSGRMPKRQAIEIMKLGPGGTELPSVVAA